MVSIVVVNGLRQYEVFRATFYAATRHLISLYTCTVTCLTKPFVAVETTFQFITMSLVLL